MFLRIIEEYKKVCWTVYVGQSSLGGFVFLNWKWMTFCQNFLWDSRIGQVISIIIFQLLSVKGLEKIQCHKQYENVILIMIGQLSALIYCEIHLFTVDQARKEKNSLVIPIIVMPAINWSEQSVCDQRSNLGRPLFSLQKYNRTFPAI